MRDYIRGIRGGMVIYMAAITAMCALHYLRDKEMTTAAAIITCALWALVGYLLGFDAGKKAKEKNDA